MYRIFPVKALIYAAALLAVGVFLAIELVTSAFDIEVRRLAIPSLVWALCVALTLNPIWRWVWSVSKRFSWLPDLGYHLFPDLNGEWEMTLRSNWSRQMQLLDAAADRRRSFDPRTCEAGELAELLEVSLVAEIPSYLQGRNPLCIEAVTRRLAKILQLELDLDSLRPESTEWELTISGMVEESEELSQQVRELEQVYDDELIEEDP